MPMKLDSSGRIAGALYVVVIVTGMFSLAYVPGQLQLTGDAESVVHSIASNEVVYRLGILSWLINSVASSSRHPDGRVPVDERSRLTGCGRERIGRVITDRQKDAPPSGKPARSPSNGAAIAQCVQQWHVRRSTFLGPVAAPARSADLEIWRSSESLWRSAFARRRGLSHPRMRRCALRQFWSNAVLASRNFTSSRWGNRLGHLVASEGYPAIPPESV